MTWRQPLLVLVVVVVAGCGASPDTVTLIRTVTVAPRPKLPPPPLARFVPAGYIVREVYHGDLSGGSVADVVVTSAGPPVGTLGFHSADLQVLSFDAIARRWTVIFDAQHVLAPDRLFVDASNSNAGPGLRSLTRNSSAASSPPTPILDPKADVQVEQVRFGALLPGGREQLLFSSTTSYGGSGVGSTLTIVDVSRSVANIVYTWTGEGLESWSVDGRTVKARAAYWTPADPHCCPIRSYAFTIALSANDVITETHDQRPYLGVLVRHRPMTSAGAVAAPLDVLAVDQDSPAARDLESGDVILDVVNALPLTNNQGGLASPIFDKLSQMNAGQTARLLIDRAGARKIVTIKLRSILTSLASKLLVPDDDYTVNLV